MKKNLQNKDNFKRIISLLSIFFSLFIILEILSGAVEGEMNHSEVTINWAEARLDKQEAQGWQEVDAKQSIEFTADNYRFTIVWNGVETQSYQKDDYFKFQIPVEFAKKKFDLVASNYEILGTVEVDEQGNGVAIFSDNVEGLESFSGFLIFEGELQEALESTTINWNFLFSENNSYIYEGIQDGILEKESSDTSEEGQSELMEKLVDSIKDGASEMPEEEKDFVEGDIQKTSEEEEKDSIEDDIPVVSEEEKDLIEDDIPITSEEEKGSAENDIPAITEEEKDSVEEDALEVPVGDITNGKLKDLKPQLNLGMTMPSATSLTGEDVSEDVIWTKVKLTVNGNEISPGSEIAFIASNAYQFSASWAMNNDRFYQEGDYFTFTVPKAFGNTKTRVIGPIDGEQVLIAWMEIDENGNGTFTFTNEVEGAIRLKGTLTLDAAYTEQQNGQEVKWIFNLSENAIIIYEGTSVGYNPPENPGSGEIIDIIKNIPSGTYKTGYYSENNSNGYWTIQLNLTDEQIDMLTNNGSHGEIIISDTFGEGYVLDPVEHLEINQGDNWVYKNELWSMQSLLKLNEFSFNNQYTEKWLRENQYRPLTEKYYRINDTRRDSRDEWPLSQWKDWINNHNVYFEMYGERWEDGRLAYLETNPQVDFPKGQSNDFIRKWVEENRHYPKPKEITPTEDGFRIVLDAEDLRNKNFIIKVWYRITASKPITEIKNAVEIKGIGGVITEEATQKITIKPTASGERAKGELAIIKRNYEETAFLKNAVFRLTKQSDEQISLIVETDSTGEALFEDLVFPEVYLLEEIASPVGYMGEIKMLIELDSEGKIQKIDDEQVTTNFSITSEGNEIGWIGNDLREMILYNEQLTTSVKVTKEWKDTGKNRPDKIRVQLFSILGENKEAVGYPVELEELSDTEWTSYVWNDIPAYTRSGEKLDYTVEEVKVPRGYTSNTMCTSESEIDGYVCSITNVEIPGIDFSFKKVDLFNNQKNLTGAKFRLAYQDDSGIMSYYQEGEDGTIRWVKRADSTILTSTLNEIVTFRDLGPGVYRLIEIEAPRGYMSPTGYWEIEILDDGRVNVTSLANSGGTTPPLIPQTGGDVLIGNIPEPHLPLTGGLGTVIFVALGGSLMGITTVHGTKKRNGDKF